MDGRPKARLGERGVGGGGAREGGGTERGVGGGGEERETETERDRQPDR